LDTKEVSFGDIRLPATTDDRQQVIILLRVDNLNIGRPNITTDYLSMLSVSLAKIVYLWFLSILLRDIQLILVQRLPRFNSQAIFNFLCIYNFLGKAFPPKNYYS
jgi:hypothetical protein